jgi:hypothetical protein
MPQVQTYYLVARIGISLRNEEWRLESKYMDDKTWRYVPEVMLPTRERAERVSASQERACRRLLNPFHHTTSLHYLTSLLPGEFRKRTQELGATIPYPNDRAEMANWWDEVIRPLNEEAFQAVWNLLDILSPFYHVLEMELEDD